MTTTAVPPTTRSGHGAAMHDSDGAGRRRRSDVHVIGGGLGGLAAAAIVARSGRTATVHEGRGRLGGRATTDDRRGYRFNQGPHAFYLGGEGAEVLARLGVRPTGAAPSTTAARMVRAGHVHIAPGSASTLARTRLLGLRDKANLAAVLGRLPKIDHSELAGTTAGAWLDELTDREAVRDVLHSIVRLTSYVNGPDHLSADVAVLQLQRGLDTGVRYLDGGWQQLVDALRATPGVEIESGQTIGALADLDAVDEGSAVIVATGSPRTAASITGHPYADGYAATAGVLDLGLATLPDRPFVIGMDEPVYLSNHGFPRGMVPEGGASVSLAEYHAVGRTEDAGSLERTDGRARLRAFAAHAGITHEQIVEERYLHRMTVVTAIPTAATGGLDGRPGVAVPERPGVFVAGDWVGRRGHLADAVLASAEEAALAAVAHLDRRAAVR